ncbi:MAG TPA: flippase [Thermoleophilaceae bacterium]|nr:flippase [Thermoleophilaceae bacterium]
MTDSDRRRVASNTAVQVAGKAAVLAIGAASIAVLTRYLGPSDYGRYTLALMYMQLFAVLADVGLLTTVVREISKDPSRTESLVGNALTLRLLLSLVTIVVAVAISLLLPYEPDVRLAIVLAGGPLLLGMLNGSLTAVFQGQMRMGRSVSADVVGRAIAFGLAVLVATLDLGFFAVMGAAAGGALATLMVSVVLSRRLVRIRFLSDRAVWRTLLLASLPLGLALAINALYFRADTLIISLLRPVDEVGFYTLAYRILEFVLTGGTVFLTASFPVISRYVADEDRRLRPAIQSSWDLFLVAGVPVVVGGAILAPRLIELVAGEDFDQAVEPLQILLAAGTLAWVNGVFGYALIAKERQASALWLNVLGLTFNVGLNLALVPAYGIVAAAVITVASEVLILGGSYLLMRRNFGFFPSPGILLPALAAAAAMGVALWPLREGPFLALAPLGAAIYLGLLLAISPGARSVVSGLRR